MRNILFIIVLLPLIACAAPQKRTAMATEPRRALDRCNPYGMNYPELNGWLPCVNEP